jgi:hypothetical protein
LVFPKKKVQLLQRLFFSTLRFVNMLVSVSLGNRDDAIYAPIEGSLRGAPLAGILV